MASTGRDVWNSNATADTGHVASTGIQAEPPSLGIPLTFIENVGQFDTRVRFQASNGNTTLFLTDDALWVSLTELPPQADPISEAKTPGAVAADDETGRQVNLKLSFIGANPHPRLDAFGELDTKVSFFTGADPSQWRADVPTWTGARYVELYPGIDLEITGQNGQMTPQLIVREPSSLQNVSVRLEGMDALAVEGNHLRLTTSLGDFALPLLTVEGVTPKTEPEISVIGEVYQVSSPFALGASLGSSLAVNETSTSNSALLYSTYLGGIGDDLANDIAVDGAGNAYIVGSTSSIDFPTTTGAYAISYNAGAYDVFVAKLSADGQTLLFSTYLGGSDEEHASGVEVDDAGNTYVAGTTYSADFPTTAGALDRELSGGRDAFVAKLNATGDSLVYSTYLGGDNWDYGNCVAIDDTGHVYVGGFTHGSFPISAGAAQATFGGSGDGFAAKLSPDGSTLLYSTYLGGYSWEVIDGISIDSSGNAYVAAHTHSTDFPTTPGAWDRVCDNCQTNVSTDAAVAKLNADGSHFDYSTLVGGATTPGGENFAGISVDDSGNAYLVGFSNSTDYPTTPNALQDSFSGGEFDAVVTKLNADGSALLYSTYLGGSSADRSDDIAIDESGNSYVVGFTASTDFPIADPLQAVNAGGDEVFVAQMNADGSELLYSTYLGGSGDDRCPDFFPHIVLGRSGTIYLVGCTSSSDFPTANALDASFNGGSYDAFVAQLSLGMFTRVTSGAIVNDGGNSSGACWGDFDNDSYIDLFVANWAGEDNFLYHNNGDGTFAKITEGRIVNDGGSSRSCTWGDYDNDGFLDLFVSNDGGGNFLYHNEGGLSFTRVDSGPIASDGGNCYGASWADYDNDGWLDLFVARHTNDDNLLYHNRGDRTFEKITQGAIVNDGGYSLSASWGDYDGDGWVDLFVANTNDQPNFLYRNNRDGSFAKISAGPLVTDVGSSSTSNWMDYDNDSDLDLFVGNARDFHQDNVLYRNDGGDTFTKLCPGAICTDGDGHNSSWGDYDNDGDLDLFAGIPQGPQRLYQNNGDGTFTRLTTGVVVADSGASGGLWGDYDNDGDLDLFVSVGYGGNNHLYRNDGNANHWLQIKLIGAALQQPRIGTVTNKTAIGARVTVAAAIGGHIVQQMQEVSGQTGMYNQNSLDLDFGFGDATVINSVSVTWPSGVTQVLTNMAVDQVLTIREPRRLLKVRYFPLVIRQ
jgi:hypothetical protein